MEYIFIYAKKDVITEKNDEINTEIYGDTKCKYVDM